MNHNTYNRIPDTTAQETLPMQMDVKIYPPRTGGSVLANASVTLNGCFAIRGIKVINGEHGPFVSMPSYKARDGYKDICFPCTKAFHQQFNDVVVDVYRQTLTQLPQEQEYGPEQPEAPLEQEPPLEQEAPPAPQMSM